MPKSTTPAVDQDAIDTAVRKLSDLRTRHAAAVADIPVAANAIEIARTAHRAALVDGGDQKAAVASAVAAHDSAVELADALAAAVQHHQSVVLPAVQSAAYEALAMHALRELHSCAVEHDKLEALHAANDLRHDEAVKLLSLASASGGHAVARSHLNGGGQQAHPREATASRPLSAFMRVPGAEWSI